MGTIRDRIKDFRRVKASDLIPNRKNWRVHPEAQSRALRSMLEDIGYANAVLARETDGGKLELIDGHLRAETMGNQKVPVLVLDVTEQEADKLLATLDPLAAMAETDASKLDALLESSAVADETLSLMLRTMADEADKAVIHEIAGEVGGESLGEALGSKRPVVKWVVAVDAVEPIERAIAATRLPNRGDAMALICKAYLDATKEEGQQHGEPEDRAPSQRAKGDR